jgi:hypothetical protein
MGYSKGGYVLGFFSPPVGPGEGPELVSPEVLFGEPVSQTEPAKPAAEVIDSSKQSGEA